MGRTDPIHFVVLFPDGFDTTAPPHSFWDNISPVYMQRDKNNCVYDNFKNKELILLLSIPINECIPGKFLDLHQKEKYEYK